jgi:hypothetical protein
MSPDERYKPPTAVVRDPVDSVDRLREFRMKLGLATLIQLALMCLKTGPAVFELVSINGLNMLGLIALLSGHATLYVGIGLLVATRARGRHLLAVSIVLQVLSLVLWHAFYLGSWGARSIFSVLLPVLWGLGLAVVGRIVPRASLAAPGQSP